MRAEENRSDVEAGLESEEPTKMGGDMSTSKDEGDRGVATTLVEHHEPMVVFIGGGWDAEKRNDVLELRKHAVSEDTAVEREAKWARSPCPSEASLTSHPPAPSVVEHAGRSGGRDHSPASPRLTHVHDPQWGDASLVALVVLP